MIFLLVVFSLFFAQNEDSTTLKEMRFQDDREANEENFTFEGQERESISIDKENELHEDNKQDFSVEMLDESRLEQIQKSNEFWMVYFSNPLCGLCKSVHPRFLEFAQEVLNDNTIHIGEVDCPQQIYTALCPRYNIRKVPTIIFFYNDKKMEYDGRNDADDYKSFAKKLKKEWKVK
ncbi:putative Thioredoxin [Monocercomonoides exilis]|uniref:putative Thioredoxin n=1 Tax=Monocercomonoides exilis TaxID=2049356 RepID=UPI00355942A4|nr:putative Thioredoxin [Monocercomonoides exilis]